MKKRNQKKVKFVYNKQNINIHFLEILLYCITTNIIFDDNHLAKLISELQDYIYDKIKVDGNMDIKETFVVVEQIKTDNP